MAPLIDIHSHILPGIDDGSQTLEQSMQMMQCAYENGIRGIILTPHFKVQHHNASPEKITNLIEMLQKKSIEAGIKIRLYAGNEINYHSSIADLLELQKVNTMAGSSYVLVEFNPMDSFERIRDGLYKTLSYGYTPILAHVERYENVCTHLDRIEDLIDMGSYIQMNAGSVMGNFGYATKYNARKIVREHLVHFIASDAHDMDNRSPAILECADYISRKYGADYEKELFSTNPAHVIKNEII